MEYILNAAEAKEVDRISITEIGIPSLVLMEKASMALADCVEKICATFNRQDIKILAVCGMGNNGGDGVACARLLKEKGYNTSVLLIGNKSKATAEIDTQIAIAINLGVEFITQPEDNEYTVIIDALFGIGLSRDIKGKYAELIQWINSQEASIIVAADIPSGISADTGRVYGCAVKADYTVTFGHNKRGIVMFPGATYSGIVTVADIGFPDKAVKKVNPLAFTYNKEDLKKLMPIRGMRTNKGSFGKVLVIAGSSGMSGACFFAAKAAYRTGCGLVRIATAKENLSILKTKLPEAITGSYEDGITEAIKWADVIAIGPGIGTDYSAQKLVSEIIKVKDKPVVIDADAINVLPKCTAEDYGSFMYDIGSNFIITPHLKEMSRLSGASVEDIQKDLVTHASHHKSGCVVVLKDARTVVSDGKHIYINTTGNNALATGGSGDVLCGIIAGLLAQKMDAMEAAALAVFIHGLTAELYTQNKNRYSMIVSDIIEELQNVLP